MTTPVQINSVFVATRNFPDKKFRIFNFLDSRQGFYLEDWSPAYDQIEKLFELKERDLVIVVMCKSVEIPGLASSVKKFISQFEYDRIFIFLEEIVSLYHKTEGYPIGKTSLHAVPSREMIYCREYDFVRKIMKGMDRSKIDIFHCEYNIEQMAQAQSIGNVKYFDWCIVDQIAAIYQSFSIDPSEIVEIDNDISIKISCFNYRYSDERYYISCILSRYPQVDFSQYYRIPSRSLDNNFLKIDKFNEDLREKILKGNKSLLSISSKHYPVPENPSDPKPILSVLSSQSTRELVYRINRSFLHLVTETRYNTPFANFSEKTLRCLYTRRPFVLLAAPGTLDLLKKLGVHTFSDYWDEGYDLIEDPILRFERVVSIIENILNKDIEELKEMLNSMKPLLDHNQQIFDDLPVIMKNFSGAEDRS